MKVNAPRELQPSRAAATPEPETRMIAPRPPRPTTQLTGTTQRDTPWRAQWVTANFALGHPYADRQDGRTGWLVFLDGTYLGTCTSPPAPVLGAPEAEVRRAIEAFVTERAPDA
jgi:hypothetical protein